MQILTELMSEETYKEKDENSVCRFSRHTGLDGSYKQFKELKNDKVLKHRYVIWYRK